MHRVSKLFATSKTTLTAGLHTTASQKAITKFNLPAMSPTMTEGTIHKWQKKEGDAFSAGDVLLELETDKAQIDVEASEDGVLAKIVLADGQKGAVNSLIALLAEEGDDISNVQVPEDQQVNDKGISSSAAEQETIATAPPTTPMAHHDLDTSMLKKPLSPAVFSLVMRHHIKDLGAIKASGPGGRILKGDVLAHLGLIAHQPAPKPRHSVAPPRDQIEFAKPAAEVKETKVKKDESPVSPNYIERQLNMDALMNLRNTLNEQNGTKTDINDLISKAAGRALQEVNDGTKIHNKSKRGIVAHTHSSGSPSFNYNGGVFKVFDLATPSYDFITDSYVGSKPYILNVNGLQRMTKTKAKQETMVDIIEYLGGGQSFSSSAARTISLNGPRSSSSPTSLQQQQGYYVDIKLQGGAPGKMMADQKARLFLDRLEYYVRHPDDLII